MKPPENVYSNVFRTPCKPNKLPLATSDLQHSTPIVQGTPVAIFPVQHPFPDRLITEPLPPGSGGTYQRGEDT